ncbi:MAG TPA: hypothetical protein VGM73_17580, partial [Candidatus Didemnitutus sp.]
AIKRRDGTVSYPDIRSKLQQGIDRNGRHVFGQFRRSPRMRQKVDLPSDMTPVFHPVEARVRR